ncbi:MAG: SDR family oxidoreductase [Proteobacteria bacterium]|nr:SDR family oxidoreductase [Pseudomonadota bacterium]
MSKSIIITGAGSGVGRAAAIAFLKRGDRVTLAGRRIDKLEETVAMSGAPAANALCMATDVTQPDQVRAMFDAAVAKFGRLDVVFNNAGTNAPGIPLEDLSVEDWKAVVDTNLSGPFYVMQNAFRVMKGQTPRGGRIINNGSVSSEVPRPDSAPYAATKHAIRGLTRVGALDGRKYDIAVCQIDIGNTLTDMAVAMTKGVKQADGSIAVEAVMDVSNVVKTLEYQADLPPEANALFVTVMATKMPFVGRG